MDFLFVNASFAVDEAFDVPKYDKFTNGQADVRVEVVGTDLTLGVVT